MKSMLWTNVLEGRRGFIGGSDARTIMGNDEAALVRLWQEKRHRSVAYAGKKNSNAFPQSRGLQLTSNSLELGFPLPKCLG